MITTYASGTLSTTGSGTEDFLSSPNEQGTFALQLDLNDMAAGDVIEVRAYKMAVTGGTQRVVGFVGYYGAQEAHRLIAIPFDPIFNSLTDSNAVRFSIKQTFGTAGISIPWAVLKDDALTPTTSGRTVDVTATGAAGIDWGNVENPTTALNLSGTNIDVDQVVASVSGAVGSVTGNVGGNVVGSVGSVTGAVGSVTGNVGGNVTGSVGSVASFGTLVADIATAVWGAVTRTLTAGTNIVLAKGTGVTGFNDLSAAQVNAEVDTALADYDPPTKAELDAGLAALNDLDAAGVRSALGLAAANLDTQLAAIVADTNELQADLANGGRVDLLIDAIKAKTDQLVFTVANMVDANIQYVNDVAVAGTGATGDEWGPA